MTDYTEPGPVTDIKAETETTSAILSWTGPADQDVTYKMQLKDIGTEEEATDAEKSYSTLTAATSYTFVVVPVCEGTRGDPQEHKFFTSEYAYIYFLALLFGDYLKQYQLS